MSEQHARAAARGARPRSRLLELPVVLVFVAKALAGVFAALAIAVAWGVWAPLDAPVEEGGQVMTPSGLVDATQTEVAGWSDTRDYGVFYRLLPGDDVENMANVFDNGPDKIWPAVTRDLYPILDDAGAIYIDANQYQDGVPLPTMGMPQKSIYVNANYLARYPILGEDHLPIVVDPAEEAWVIAVPATLKAYEAQMEEWLLKVRRGIGGIQGVSEANERFSGDSAPERFRTQDVRIVWMQPDQDVFSFDSTINRSGGNIIHDPIVEIMTPANSLPVDRGNAVTGGPDTALKVFTGGDPAGTYQRLLPTLQRLDLDDNIKQLVFANEAPLLRLDQAEAEARISRATAASIAVVMLALGAGSAVMIVARLRRVLIVRRLHGFSVARRNRELLIAGGLSTAGMLLMGGLALWADRAGGYAPASYRGIASGDLWGVSARLGAIVLALSAVELTLALLVAGTIQRRTGALLVKNL